MKRESIKRIVKAVGLDDEIDLESQENGIPPLLDMMVDPGQEPLRIDRFIQSKTTKITRSKIQKMIESDLVKVNGNVVKTNHKIKPGDHIEVEDTREEVLDHIVAEDCLPPIVHEDGDLLIVNKPAGMVCHPGHGIHSGTLLNGLAKHFHENREEYTLPRFGLLHRIDKNTSGLLVIAKTVRALRKLQNQFFKHTIERKYIALVWGDVEEDEGTIQTKIGRHPRYRNIMSVMEEHEKGKEAITHYKVIERFGYVTLIECELETGRTHQIRVHMKHLGHPLFNDVQYGGNRILKGTVYSKYKSFVENCFKIMPRHALHAKTLGFKHPGTKEETLYSSEIPEDFSSVIEKWRRYTKARQA